MDDANSIDWKAQCQDQTDLYNRAQARVRTLESALAAKDKAHKERVRDLEQRADAIADQVIAISKGQGMVPKAEHDRALAKIGKLEAKLRATKAPGAAPRADRLPGPPAPPRAPPSPRMARVRPPKGWCSTPRATPRGRGRGPDER